MKSIDKQSVTSWGNDELYFIYDGVAVANSIKDPKAAIEIVSSVLSKIEKIKQSCGTSMLTWDAKEEKKANEIIKGLPKAKSIDVELAMIKKMPKENLDAAVYKGAHFAKARKTIYNLMSADLKKSADAEREKAYKAIVKKAKSAEKETFTLDGFYLGMTFDEMMVVFDYLFPGIEMEEAIDGKGRRFA